MYCISISHKAAAVDEREKFAFSIEEQIDFIKQMIEKTGISGCIMLSTCNRSEVYFTGVKAAINEVEKAVAVFKKIELSELLKYFRIYEGRKAVSHLFYVASGLDSMIVGEDEILGQVKKAYYLAIREETTSDELNMLFQSALNCAKKVKNKTLLSKTPISIGTLVAHEIFSFEKAEGMRKNVLIIGMMGKVGTIIMKNIYHRGDLHIVGTTRQHGYSLNMKAENVSLIQYSQRYQFLDEADIIISATTSPHYTLTYEAARQAIRTDKTRLFIDLAVPGDMDKEIEKLPFTQLYDIDHFNALSQLNSEVKLKEAERGALIIEEEAEGALKKCYFQQALRHMTNYPYYFKDKNFEQILYELRDAADDTELEVILRVVERMIDQQYRMESSKQEGAKGGKSIRNSGRIKRQMR